MVKRKGKQAMVAESSEGGNGMTPNPFLHAYAPIPHSKFKCRDNQLKVGFNTDKELKKFYELYYRPMESTRWPHCETMETMGCREELHAYCRRVGLENFFTSELHTFKTITCEFFATFRYKPRCNGNPVSHVSFQLLGNTLKWSLRTLAQVLKLPMPSSVNGKVGQRSQEDIDATNAFWKHISRGSVNFNPAKAKLTSIRNFELRYLARIFQNVLFPSKETRTSVSASTIQLCYECLHPRERIPNGEIPSPLDLVTKLAIFFDKEANSPSKVLCCGGIITMIAMTIGFDPRTLPPLSSDIFLGRTAANSFAKVGSLNLGIIVNDKRAIQLPSFASYTLSRRRNWDMPLSPNEYVFRGRGLWIPINYGLREGDIRYEESFAEVVSEEDDDDYDPEGDDDEEDENEDEEEGDDNDNEDYNLEHEGNEDQFDPMETQADPIPTPQQTNFSTNAQDLGSLNRLLEDNNNHMAAMLAEIQTQGRDNRDAWARQERVNVDLSQRMARLEVQQREYLNPIFTQTMGYAPTGYNPYVPPFTPPEGFTWDERGFYRGPGWGLPPP